MSERGHAHGEPPRRSGCRRGAPRYTGVRTFAGLPHLPAAELPLQGPGRPSACVLGVPFDTATSWRPGARFGPEAIRSASVLLRPWHPLHGVEVLAAGQVVDAGDVAITPGNAARSAEQLAAALSPLCAAGIAPVLLGGDHSILLGELRAHAAASGPLALILLDAHADTWDDYYGERIFHGTVVRRALEEGLLEPQRSLIAGLRGSLYASDDLADARELGLELMPIEVLRETGATAFSRRARERVGQGPSLLGIDIDVMDPSVAPGTGTPEVGGLLAAEALALVRALAGIPFVGYDIVELAPPYDSAGQISALMAANLAYEALALAALAPARG